MAIFLNYMFLNAFLAYIKPLVIAMNNQTHSNLLKLSKCYDKKTKYFTSSVSYYIYNYTHIRI